MTFQAEGQCAGAGQPLFHGGSRPRESRPQGVGLGGQLGEELHVGEAADACEPVRGERPACLGLVALGVDGVYSDGEANDEDRDDGGEAAAEARLPARGAGALLLCGGEPLAQGGLGRIGVCEAGELDLGDAEIAVLEGGLEQGASGLLLPGDGALVCGPEEERLLEGGGDLGQLCIRVNSTRGEAGHHRCRGAERLLQPVERLGGDALALPVPAERAQGFLERGDGGIAILGRAGHRLVADGGEAGQDARGEGRRVGGGGGHERCHHVLGGVGGAARQDLEEGRAEEVYVCPRAQVGAGAAGELGGPVGGGAARTVDLALVGGDRVEGGRIAVVGDEAPVGDEDLAELADEHVGGLEIVVEEAAVVGEGDGVRGGEEDLDVRVEIDLAGLPLLAEPVLPGAPADELHDEGRALVGLDQVVHGDDAGVIELGADARLGQEVVAEGAGDALDALDGDVAVERLLVGAVDDGAASAADGLLELEALLKLGAAGGARGRRLALLHEREELVVGRPKAALVIERRDRTDGGQGIVLLSAANAPPGRPLRHGPRLEPQASASRKGFRPLRRCPRAP
ncbi:MAG: hypothetical protein R3F14_06130 [Polyangiaceae bacterium]